MTATQQISLLEMLDLPSTDGHVEWDNVTSEQLHELIRGAVQELSIREPVEPTNGVLQRSLQLEETARAMYPLQHRYAGLLQDAYNTPKLRETLDLAEGKTPFRDAADLIAKTHGLRAYEASARTKIAAAMTPARASDPERDDQVAVGETKFPRLGALHAEGKIHPTKLSSALKMLDEVDQNAEDAGKDEEYRNKLRSVVEKDLAEKIEGTTPEEFGRYVREQKKNVLASIDPPDNAFTEKQTDAMHNVWCEGPVRGNPEAYKWSIITDAEGNEVLNTVEAMANNPRAKDDDNEFDKRSRGQRSMHAIRDALKFALANRDSAGFRGASSAHTQMVVLSDYPTLLQGLRDELAELLPDIQAEKREQLLSLLAQAEQAELGEVQPDEDMEGTGNPDEDAGETLTKPRVLTLPTHTTLQGDSTHEKQDRSRLQTVEADGTKISIPPPKTTNIAEIFDDENLDRLQPQVSRGIYTPYIPPQALLRMMCNISVSPITLTGQRQVLSIGRKSRQFSEALRRAILARDRGCAVPGCHWPAAWCELHHIKYWSDDGETSTENGVMLCSHHHKAMHAKMLQIERVNGEIRFKLHPLIDPAQQPRKNYFWQA